MESMFSGAHAFDKAIGNWDTPRSRPRSTCLLELIPPNVNCIPCTGTYPAAYHDGPPKAWAPIAAASHVHRPSAFLPFPRHRRCELENREKCNSWSLKRHLKMGRVATTMEHLFQGQLEFNQPIGLGHLQGQEQEGMFQGCEKFGSHLQGHEHGGNVPKLREFQSTDRQLANAGAVQSTAHHEFDVYLGGSFNRYIGSWDTSKVTDTKYMFQMASASDANPSPNATVCVREPSRARRSDGPPSAWVRTCATPPTSPTARRAIALSHWRADPRANPRATTVTQSQGNRPV